MIAFARAWKRREPRLAVPTCTFCRHAGLARRRNTSYALQRAKAPHVRPLAAPYGNSAASVTRPAKDEILVMGRQVPSVRLDDAAAGSLPSALRSPVSATRVPHAPKRHPRGSAVRLTNGPFEEYQRLSDS
jgi:hypothetical protein